MSDFWGCEWDGNDFENSLPDSIGYCDGLGCNGRAHGCFCEMFSSFTQKVRSECKKPWRAFSREEQRRMEIGFRLMFEEYRCKVKELYAINHDSRKQGAAIGRLTKELEAIHAIAISAGDADTTEHEDDTLTLRYVKRMAYTIQNGAHIEARALRRAAEICRKHVFTDNSKCDSHVSGQLVGHEQCAEAIEAKANKTRTKAIIAAVEWLYERREA